MTDRSYRLRLLLAVALTMAALFVWRVASRAYSTEMTDFESWPVNDIAYHPERTGVPGLVNVTIRTPTGQRIRAWYVPSRNSAAVVLLHGTNADRSSLLAEVRILSTAGFGVLDIDGPGYGGSDGKVLWSEPERKALEAAIDWLAARPDVDASRIGGFSFSMGGYTLAQVAASDQRLRALVFAATPPDIRETVDWQHRKWGLLSRASAEFALRRSGMPLAQYPPRGVIAAISPRPVFILGEDQDPIVPAFLVEELFADAREPKTLWLMHGARHGLYDQIEPARYAQRLVEFYRRSLLATAVPR